MAIQIELSNFAYIDRPRRLGRALRFTFAIHIDCQNGNVGEIALDGCLAYYRGDDGDFVWSAPISRFSWVATKQLHWVNPYLYGLVKDALLSNPKLLAPVMEVYEDIKKLKAKEKLGIWGAEVDPNIPKLIKITSKQPPPTSAATEPVPQRGDSYAVHGDGKFKPPTAFRGDNYGHYVKNLKKKKG